ncbi:PEP-CTERM sorting domain-containing protein [Neptunomonas phycophila]|uniref:PEP-CTERM sorting domain-containing protein n=1 Tax=Neptunomonas phycophila TaxID=1572645 RepID=UPI001BEC00AE|nr:PEP-CTERM sorting domain-containing protein [Neptunomonas phycophila]MBT3144142.1 PEP-CTERM sorting domain-containing protein [Neptunomonas phycophila]
MFSKVALAILPLVAALSLPSQASVVIQNFGTATSPSEFAAGNTQTTFSVGDTVYAGEVFDLQALDAATDDANSDGFFSWHAVWYDPLGLSFSSNMVNIAWEDIITAQGTGDSSFVVTAPSQQGTSGGSVSFVQTPGVWSVNGVAEGQVTSTASFEVPEPETLLLLLLGGLLMRRKRKG